MVGRLGDVLYWMGCGVAATFLAAHAQAPTATEAFNLRIRCKQMSDAKAEELRWHPMSDADGASIGLSPKDVAAINGWGRPQVILEWNSSNYDPRANRCYVRIYQHRKRAQFDLEYDQVYDAQTDDLLVFANVQNGAKSGVIFAPNWPAFLARSSECQASSLCAMGAGWDAAETYMNEIMKETSP